MKCHVCGHPMQLEFSRVYLYPKSGKPRAVWRCTNKLFCSEERWAHPDGTPMSVPADQATKQARIVAHVALDNLIRTKRFARNQAYRWVQRAMGMTKDEAHIGHFDTPTCLRLVDLVYRELDQDSSELLRSLDEMSFPDLFSEAGLDSIFDHHVPPNPETGLALSEVRAIMKDAARSAGAAVPGCPEKTLMIRYLQMAMFWGCSAISQHGPNPKGIPSAPPDPPG